MSARAADALSGMVLARTRLRSRSVLLIALLCVALAVSAGIIEHGSAALGAADRALGAVTRLVLPLAVFGLTTKSVGRQRVHDSVWSLARFGSRRRDLAFGLIASTALASMLVALACVMVALPVAYGGVGWVGDAVTSCWIACLAAVAYTAWFAAGATFGRFGGGRWIVLVADFVLGSTDGVLALPLPRAHLRNLIGGSAPLELAQSHSSAILVATTLVALAIALRRSGD